MCVLNVAILVPKIRPRDCQAVVKCAECGSESHCTILHVGKSESQQSAHSESQGNEQPQRFANKNAASQMGLPDAHSREEHSHGGENANGGMPQVSLLPSSSGFCNVYSGMWFEPQSQVLRQNCPSESLYG